MLPQYSYIKRAIRSFGVCLSLFRSVASPRCNAGAAAPSSPGTLSEKQGAPSNARQHTGELTVLAVCWRVKQGAEGCAACIGLGT